jgi:hypothetical protein
MCLVFKLNLNVAYCFEFVRFSMLRKKLLLISDVSKNALGIVISAGYKLSIPYKEDVLIKLWRVYY